MGSPGAIGEANQETKKEPVRHPSLKHWTAIDDATLRRLLVARKSHSEIASGMGRTTDAVRCRAFFLKKSAPPPPPCSLQDVAQKWGENASPPPPFPTDADPKLPPAEEPESLVAFWKKRAKEAEKAFADLEHSRTALEMISEQMHELAPKSYQPAPLLIDRLEGHHPHGTPQSAVLMFSDTHVGAVVDPKQTLGLGEYNFELFLRRLKRMERSVFSILRDHTTTEVPELVIPMLGDMLDGALIHSAECGQSNTLLSQFYSAGHAIAQLFRNLSALVPKVRVYTTVGNHTRWGTQHRMPTKNRNSNFDQLLYLYIQALTRDIPAIEWNLSMQPFATFDVQGFPFYCLHGDGIRGGDKILGLPAHGLGRMVSTTTQLFSRANRETPAFYLMGHLHRPIEIPHSKGSVIINGAFPGIDGYALAEYFNSSWPLQKFWLMHPKFGRSATYDLRLDLGDQTPHGYELPESDFLMST